MSAIEVQHHQVQYFSPIIILTDTETWFYFTSYQEPLAFRKRNRETSFSINITGDVVCEFSSQSRRVIAVHTLIVVLPKPSMRHWLVVHKSLRGQSFRTTSHGIT